MLLYQVCFYPEKMELTLQCCVVLISDCQKFEILQLENNGGTCDVIYSEEGGLTFHYCMEKCLDLPNCRGATFDPTTGKCDYHDCANYTATPGVGFFWKKCIDNGMCLNVQQIPHV